MGASEREEMKDVFLPPLGTEDYARLSTSSAKKISVLFFSTRRFFIYNIAEIFKMLCTSM